jgi:hypothetical protein
MRVILRYTDATPASRGVLLCPALPYGLLRNFRWQRCVQAAVSGKELRRT